MNSRTEQTASRDLGSSLGSGTATAIDQMIRWPFWFTGATMDLMLQGMERMTGQTDRAMGSAGSNASGDTSARASSGSSWGATSTGPSQSASASTSSGDDQDLSGDDLKYVLWSILFCKPGYEAVLEPQQDDIVNYSADGASYAAVKIAKYLERARHGRTEKPALWNEKGYPSEAATAKRRAEPANIAGGNAQTASERGWRIPADDQKYVKFVYRVERRLPKEEPEVTRIERVTVERGVDSRTSVA